MSCTHKIQISKFHQENKNNFLILSLIIDLFAIIIYKSVSIMLDEYLLCTSIQDN